MKNLFVTHLQWISLDLIINFWLVDVYFDINSVLTGQTILYNDVDFFFFFLPFTYIAHKKKKKKEVENFYFQCYKPKFFRQKKKKIFIQKKQKNKNKT